MFLVSGIGHRSIEGNDKCSNVWNHTYAVKLPYSIIIQSSCHGHLFSSSCTFSIYAYNQHNEMEKVLGGISGNLKSNNCFASYWLQDPGQVSSHYSGPQTLHLQNVNQGGQNEWVLLDYFLGFFPQYLFSMNGRKDLQPRWIIMRGFFFFFFSDLLQQKVQTLE